MCECFLKERLSLFALRETSHLGPFSAMKTGNSNARVTILPQSLQPQDAVVHPCLILADISMAA